MEYDVNTYDALCNTAYIQYHLYTQRFLTRAIELGQPSVDLAKLDLHFSSLTRREKRYRTFRRNGRLHFSRKTL
jgi:hypothetical protein